MSVGSKNILNFESTGYSGDIVFSCDDLTIEHPEFLKLDGGTYKKADYQQIEKYFTYQNVVPLDGEMLINTMQETRVADAPHKWLYSQNGDDIAVAFCCDDKASNNSYMYLWLYLSKDGGKTFTKGSRQSFSGYHASSQYEKRLIRYKDKTMFFYKDSYNSDSGYVYCHCIKDGATSWTVSTVENSYCTSSLYIIPFGNYVIAHIYSKGKNPYYYLRYADVTNDKLSFTTLDSGDISADYRNTTKIPNTNKLIYGSVVQSNGKFRVYNDDLTYTEYDSIPSNHIPAISGLYGNYAYKMFYRNNEYIIFGGDSSYGYYLLKTKDFINFTGEVMQTPAYGSNTDSYGFYFGEFNNIGIFANYNSHQIQTSIMSRNLESYTPEGTIASFGENGYTTVSISDTIKSDENGYYVAVGVYKTDDTICYFKIIKKYLRNVTNYFRLPTAKTISSSLGVSSDKYPYIRTE